MGVYVSYASHSLRAFKSEEEEEDAIAMGNDDTPKFADWISGLSLVVDNDVNKFSCIFTDVGDEIGVHM